MTQGLWLPDVCFSFKQLHGLPMGRPLRFLYTDPTPSALQVFVRQPGTAKQPAIGLPAEGEEEGVWINADPIPDCVVCNIGESECF